MTDASEVVVSDADKVFLIEEHAAAMCAGAESDFDAWITAIKALIAKRVPPAPADTNHHAFDYGFNLCRERVLRGES